MINRALARREDCVSFRIGTRGHAWREHGFIFGADAKLEEERDYKFVDLDSMLRRNENRKTWIFPGFVADVFARRLGHAGLAVKGSDGKRLLASILGPGLKAPDKARRYGGRSPRRSIRLDDDWPEGFKRALCELAEEDPLSARLLESWVLQTLVRASGSRRRAALEQLNIRMLDEMKKKEWWIKERIELALIQIAARCQERPVWCGHDEVVALSGGSILILSLCQFIWDTHNQLSSAGQLHVPHPAIEPMVQAIGVFKASDHWLQKVTTETGRSGDRLRLVRQIGTALAQHLYNDRT